MVRRHRCFRGEPFSHKIEVLVFDHFWYVMSPKELQIGQQNGLQFDL